MLAPLRAGPDGGIETERMPMADSLIRFEQVGAGALFGEYVIRIAEWAVFE